MTLTFYATYADVAQRAATLFGGEIERRRNYVIVLIPVTQFEGFMDQIAGGG